MDNNQRSDPEISQYLKPFTDVQSCPAVVHQHELHHDYDHHDDPLLEGQHGDGGLYWEEEEEELSAGHG